MNLNGNALTIERDVVIKAGTFDVNGGSCKITGSLTQESGQMNLNGGNLEVGGDYRIQKYNAKSKSYGDSDGRLWMEGEKDEVVVGGDFYTQSTGGWSYNWFGGGTLTLKGNFTQLKGNEENFQAYETKVVFAGSGRQEISFETPESSYFYYPVFKNTNIAVKSAIGNWNLNEDLVIKDEGYPLEIVGDMNLNGKTLMIERDVVLKAGACGVNGGECEIAGNLTQESGQIYVNGGKLEVGGDYRIQKYNTKSKSYGDSDGGLSISGANPEVVVGGDFYAQSTNENYFSEGTLTLKGNFTQLKGNEGNFQAYGTTVVFAGSGIQEISFENPESSYFRYPVFKNTNIAVKSAIGNWNLNEDLVIKDEGYPLEIVGDMNLNGKALTIERDVVLKAGTCDVNGGDCEITGNLTQESGQIYVNGGKLEIGGDYRIQKYNTKSQSYGDSEGGLDISGANPEVIVGGDFYTQSTGYNCFSAGTLTLKGNFTQLKGSEENFQAYGTKVVFAGTGVQEVYFETPSASYISNPVYQNKKVCYMGKRRIALSANNGVLTAVLPGNDNAVSEGIIYSRDSNPTIETPGRTRVAFTETTNDQVTFDASALKGNTFRAYVIIKDVGGTERVFYSKALQMAE